MKNTETVAIIKVIDKDGEVKEFELEKGYSIRVEGNVLVTVTEKQVKK
jgi:RNase P/RNase MRP subunit p29